MAVVYIGARRQHTQDPGFRVAVHSLRQDGEGEGPRATWGSVIDRALTLIDVDDVTAVDQDEDKD